MSQPLAIILGLVLGFAGGAAHLAITAWRTRQLTRAGPLLVLVTFPLALLPPVAGVLLAAWLARPAAWASAGGLLLAHAVVLLRAGSRP